MMKHFCYAKTWIAITALLAGLLVTGCEAPWDDESNFATGTSTVQGNVSSFAFGAVTVRLDLPPATADNVFAALARGLGNLLVPDAHAADLGGITVYIRGTDISTTTSPDGSFVLSGIPAGTYELAILWQGREAVYPFSIGDNQRLVLSGIRVLTDGSVAVSSSQTTNVSGASQGSSVSSGGSSDSAPSSTSSDDSSSGSSGGSSGSSSGGFVEMPV